MAGAGAAGAALGTRIAIIAGDTGLAVIGAGATTGAATLLPNFGIARAAVELRIRAMETTSTFTFFIFSPYIHLVN